MSSLATISKGLTVSDIVIPIIGVLILAGVGILIFPYIQGIFDKNSEYTQLKNEISQLKEKYTTLEQINVTSQVTILSKLNSLIPTNMEVSTLAIHVKSLAERYGLVAESITLQQSDHPGITSISDVRGLSGLVFPEGLNVVAGPFVYVGDITNIGSFLDELTSKGVLISVNDLAIRHVEGFSDTIDANRYTSISDPWRITFNVVCYSLEDPQDFSIITPVAVFDTAIIESELEYRNVE
ncbi:hypothetical protein JW962_01830 [Candidatus Dojkabacteria bacterium]|nr:hypothetical protein [Candidatus Dojkabacteria bacterium]